MAPQTAVVVDQWALLRLGITTVLRTLGVRVAGQDHRGREGVEQARAAGAALIVLGNHLDIPAVDAVRQAKRLDPAPRVIVLVGGASGDELVALLDAGADALLVRSVEGDELSDGITRVLAGERVVAPALLPAMVGMVDSQGLGGEAAGDVHLTGKEREVLVMLAAGRSNREISEALFVSAATVKTHLTHLYSKLGVGDRRQAVARAVALGLLG